MEGCAPTSVDSDVTNERCPLLYRVTELESKIRQLTTAEIELDPVGRISTPGIISDCFTRDLQV
jgi:hypothetical protein